MKATTAFAFVLSLALLPVSAQGQPADPQAKAKDFLARFVAKDPSLAVDFDEAMKKAFSPAQATAAADQLAARGGAFRGFGLATIEAKGGYVAALVKGEYERIVVDFRVTFDAEGRIAGFFVQNITAQTGLWKLPDYAKPGTYTEETRVVDTGGWPLEATLAIPRGKGPWPALVLVHGSGPNDRDESIGPNKVFADLAAGLASRGIAVLRYEKRTKAHGQRIADEGLDIGVREETIDDAVAALALLAREPRVDPKRIFLVGHSLGAMLGPRMAAEAAKGGRVLAGLVLLAPNARPLEDIVVDQVAYLAKLDGSVSTDEEAAISDLRAAALRVKALPPLPSPADPGAGELPLGLSAAYWRSLAGYDPVATAAMLALRLLVLHGARDYQVMGSEAELWRKGLAGRKGARVSVLAGLNHLMIRGSGAPTPAEYDREGHVDASVISAISAFVMAKR